MRNKFGETLSDLLMTREDLYFVTADTGNAKVGMIREALGGRYINVGIAEQNMTGVAAGLALEGKTVVINSIGNFPILRCYEQIRNDIAYHNLNVKICVTGGGFSYGPAGVTHHATEDFSVMRAIPGMTCFAPGDPPEVEACTRLMLETPGPCYMRIGYQGERSIHQEPLSPLRLGKALELKKGTQAAILCAGNILDEGARAAELLEQQGVSAGLYSFPCIKPLDEELIKELAASVRIIISVEENVMAGGFGSAVAETISQLEHPRAVLRMICLSDQFPQMIGDKTYLRNYYQITCESIVKVILPLLD